jgi:hypothetical protein
MFQGQPREKVCKIPSQPMAGHDGAYLSSQLHEEVQTGRLQSRLAQIQSQTLPRKVRNAKRTVVVAQVIECLPGKCKALSSMPVLPKKKKKRGGEKREKERSQSPADTKRQLYNWSNYKKTPKRVVPGQ